MKITMDAAAVENEAREAIETLVTEIPFLTVTSVSKEDRVGGGLEIDFRIRVRSEEGDSTDLLAKVRSSGQPRHVRKAINQLRLTLSERSEDGSVDSYGIVVAPYITDRTGSLITEAGLGYLDLAGNGHLSFDGVYVDRRGHENPYSEKKELQSLFARKASRVIRVLLSDARRGWKTKELAREAEVSLGHVSNVRQKLLATEWARDSSSGLELTDPEALLQAWAEAYDDSKSIGRGFYGMDEIRLLEERLEEIQPSEEYRYALTVFSGADRIAPHVRYQRATAYVRGRLKEIADALGVKPVDSGANLELIHPYDDGVFFGTRKENELNVVSPAQLYLDLSSRPGRGAEAAEFLLDQVLKPAWTE